jgi:septum formation protein
MLEAAGVPFQIVESDLDEESAKAAFRARNLASAELADALAEAKAVTVIAEEEDFVLGSDQVLERSDGTMLSKPSSREEAMEQLRSLSGSTHQLHSAAVVAQRGETVWRCTESVALTTRPLSDAFLRSYLDMEYEAIRWSVGGYRIEGPGIQLFDKIEGSHFAILGLPLLPLLSFLRERGVIQS